jgi:drug/metabolite transporter (DMT)-like permease
LLGVLLVVSGIALVADLARSRTQSPRAGILWGLTTGACIAAYTLNDGWAVRFLALSPIVVDYSGNLFRALALAPRALTNVTQLRQEMREFGRQALVVGILGPLGYILVLWAMTMAPISHVAPTRELATLVGTYLGGRLLKEQVGWSRITGALCIILGVICLSASNY